MTNYFRREPFVRLTSGECDYCDSDAYHLLFMSYISDAYKVCGECEREILEDW